MQASALLSASPSLNSYSASNNTLAEIAASVAHELGLNQPPPFDWEPELPKEYHEEEIPRQANNGELERSSYEDEEEEEDDNEFEFAFACGNPASSPVPADEIFHNGQIKPIYPVFALHSASFDECSRIDGEGTRKPPRRPALKALMNADRTETTIPEPEAESSCSSSEAEELDGITPGTYCVWNPRAAAASPGNCKKSSSTGSSSSSSRWKLKQLLLNRSNSDGTNRLVLVAGKTARGGRVADGVNGADGDVKARQDSREKAEVYVRNHNNSRRKSFLPYRADLVGFFTNVNGLSRNLHPF